ncbi:hypothetical protein V6N12_068261 [Hibiscus sabdariffa]|uniref:Uncharacterized protein n=1 Tax=Hibiscus sabdariffa TaxID=183260 RepID=A0ABR2FPJ7_9ROSI
MDVKHRRPNVDICPSLGDCRSTDHGIRVDAYIKSQEGEGGRDSGYKITMDQNGMHDKVPLAIAHTGRIVVGCLGECIFAERHLGVGKYKAKEALNVLRHRQPKIVN